MSTLRASIVLLPLRCSCWTRKMRSGKCILVWLLKHTHNVSVLTVALKLTIAGETEIIWKWCLHLTHGFFPLASSTEMVCLFLLLCQMFQFGPMSLSLGLSARCLVLIVDFLMPKTYYSKTLMASQVDQVCSRSGNESFQGINYLVSRRNYVLDSIFLFPSSPECKVCIY